MFRTHSDSNKFVLSIIIFLTHKSSSKFVLSNIIFWTHADKRCISLALTANSQELTNCTTTTHNLLVSCLSFSVSHQWSVLCDTGLTSGHNPNLPANHCACSNSAGQSGKAEEMSTDWIKIVFLCQSWVLYF